MQDGMISNVEVRLCKENMDWFPCRSDFCAAVVDGKIYIAGGWPVGYSKTLDSVEVLDIGKGEWQEITGLPTPRGDCKCAQLSGELVVLGGFYDPKNEWANDSFRDEVEAYNPVSIKYILDVLQGLMRDYWYQ